MNCNYYQFHKPALNRKHPEDHSLPISRHHYHFHNFHDHHHFHAHHYHHDEPKIFLFKTLNLRVLVL